MVVQQQITERQIMRIFFKTEHVKYDIHTHEAADDEKIVLERCVLNTQIYLNYNCKFL